MSRHLSSLLLLPVILLVLAAPPAAAQDAVLVPGDTFSGDIDGPFDRDELHFDGVAGTLLGVTVSGKNGLRPALELVSLPERTPVDLGPYLKGAGKPKLSIKSLPLPATGSYALTVTTGQGTGPYKLTTKLKVPGPLKKLATTGSGAPGDLELTFAAQAGTLLTATVKAAKGAVATPGVPLLAGPSGPLDLEPATLLTAGKQPAAKVTGLLLAELGSYTFTPTLAEPADGEPPLATTLKLKWPKPVKVQHVEPPTFANQETETVSVNTAGQLAASWSIEPAISFDGRRVAFLSSAINLVPGCGGGSGTLGDPLKFDVFVRDVTGTSPVTVVASAPSRSTAGQGGCEAPALDDAGDVVAFASSAAGLVDGDTNGKRDVFVHLPDGLLTTRVSVATGGGQAQGDSYDPDLSGDGRLVVFTSSAANLVAGDGNGALDVFLHDRLAGSTLRVSTRADGGQAAGDSSEPVLSRDGLAVAFVSAAPDLVDGDGNGVTRDVFVKRLDTQAVLLASVQADGTQVRAESNQPAISGDGRFVAFVCVGPLLPGDGNNKPDVYVKDLVEGTLELASVSGSGAQGNGPSSQPRLSANGQFVLFRSQAQNLVPGPDINTFLGGDVFLRNRPVGTTIRINHNDFGDQADGDCYVGDLAGDASAAVFTGFALNMGPPADLNNSPDVWLRR